MPFANPIFIAEFNNDFTNNYNEVLKRVDNFITKYLYKENSFKVKTLGRSILELIKNDEYIDDEQKFFLFANKEPIMKKDIPQNIKISLQELLLAALYYIVTNKVLNEVGKDTIIEWHEKTSAPNAQKRFNSKIGINTYQDSIIYLLGATDSKFIPVQEPIDKETEDFNFAKYMKKAKRKFESLRTLLYTEQPHKFEEFYVCNDITSYSPRINHFFGEGEFYFNFDFDFEHYNLRNIQDATASKLIKTLSNMIIITGTGGLGKSMMMRHLLLEAIKSYDENKMIPLFVTLKDYDSSYSDMLHFVYSKFTNLCTISLTNFKKVLENGEMLILLDGYDEIHSDNLQLFTSQLEAFTDKYSSNAFIVSSRPYSDFLGLYNFDVVRLRPLQKSQALELIEKLEFRPDVPEIKNKFKVELEKNLYTTHESFANNPLLLTIMLMTFEQYAEVPSKMHIFYREAFLTLSQKHDASKGAYKRALKTGLTADRFSDYLSEFCSRTYCEQKFELTTEEFKKYFNSLNEHKRYNEKIACSDFIEDLKSNMCLIYFEGNKYHFTHRSFQEYFCAVYFSKQKDKNLSTIGSFFEKQKRRTEGDKTFQMLYDMIPDKMDEYLIKPFLENLLVIDYKDDEYLSFLHKVYDVIEYSAGEEILYSPVISCSFLYSFIREKFNLRKSQDVNLPLVPVYVTHGYTLVRDSNGETQLSMVCDGYKEKFEDNELKPNGWFIEFSVQEVLSHPEDFKELIEALKSDKCCYKKEYLEAKQLLNKLLEDANAEGTDMFDLFN